MLFLLVYKRGFFFFLYFQFPRPKTTNIKTFKPSTFSLSLQQYESQQQSQQSQQSQHRIMDFRANPGAHRRQANNEPGNYFLFFKGPNSVNIYYNLFRRTTTLLVRREHVTGVISRKWLTIDASLVSPGNSASKNLTA